MSDLYDQAFNQLAAVIGVEAFGERLVGVDLLDPQRERDIAANYAAQLRQLSNDLGQAAGNIEETLRRDGA